MKNGIIIGLLSNKCVINLEINDFIITLKYFKEDKLIESSKLLINNRIWLLHLNYFKLVNFKVKLSIILQ